MSEIVDVSLDVTSVFSVQALVMKGGDELGRISAFQEDHVHLKRESVCIGFKYKYCCPGFLTFVVCPMGRARVQVRIAPGAHAVRRSFALDADLHREEVYDLTGIPPAEQLGPATKAHCSVYAVNTLLRGQVMCYRCTAFQLPRNIAPMSLDLEMARGPSMKVVQMPQVAAEEAESDFRL